MASEALQLKEEIEELKDKISRAKGAYQNICQTIQDEFGVSIKEARELRKELEEKLELTQRKRDKAYRLFTKKYGSKLKGT